VNKLLTALEKELARLRDTTPVAEEGR
jgi:hypothetical protein